MTALLALAIILTWGTWIPAAQLATGVPQRQRVLYVTIGNLVIASGAILAGGGTVSFGWRAFWLPFVGGLVWVGGNYTAFRASESIGLARANGTWAPINIIVSFVWGALLFGELASTSAWRLAVLVISLFVVIGGVLLIVGSQETPKASLPGPSARAVIGYRAGFAFAAAAGVLWGSYFIPAQWAGVAAQVGNFPLALGLAAGGAVLGLSGGHLARLKAKELGTQLLAGVLFGAGNLALLGLVKRVGTGVGFTLAQLSLLVNASIGIYVFKVPLPGSASAKKATIGILLAGAGGVAIGALR